MKRIQGILVYNASFTTGQFAALFAAFTDAFEAAQCSVRLVASSELPILFTRSGNAEIGRLSEKGLEISSLDFVLFWDKDVRLAAAFERAGVRVFNSAASITLCDNKMLTFERLSGHGIPMPLTISSPLVFSAHNDGAENDHGISFDFIERSLAYPMIIKEAYGSLGMQVYLIENHNQLVAKHRQLKHKLHLFQEFVSSSKGTDLRIYVLGGRAVAACIRKNACDFRSNTAFGGTMELVKPDKAAAELAERAAGLLGLDYGSVDFLFAADGSPILCEVNSNAFFKTLHRVGGADIARLYVDYIINEVGA